MKNEWMIMAGLLLLCACDPLAREPRLDPDPDPATLQEVARMLSALPMEAEHFREVYAAVTASQDNGYDEEYTMRDLFAAPGTGVGDASLPAASGTKAAAYERPLRGLILSYMTEKYRTKAGEEDAAAVAEAVRALTESDVQIYWPFSEGWDGRTEPLVTFDPGTGAETNVAYSLDGEEVIVTESLARTRPVWVVNRNGDSGYMTLELYRKQNPGLEDPFVRLHATPSGSPAATSPAASSAGNDSFRTLVMKDFRMNRHYDPWFAGASEFWVKAGPADGFTASTEAELRLFFPTVTDFLVVVKRRQLGETVPFNVVLISEWTDSMENIAFMITEDDGGTVTSWKLDTTVKIQSKSYGLTVDLPIRTRDDIVWRGNLSRNYIERYSGRVQHFGDVDLTLELR